MQEMIYHVRTEMRQSLVIIQVQILSKGIDSGYLVCTLLLQFYADPFETLQLFLSWSADVHVVYILSSD